MLLDDDGVLGQLDHVFVDQRVAVAQLARHVDGLDAAFLAGLRELHLDQLGADRAADDRVLAGGQRRLEHVELVRVDRALHHRLAQAVAGGDEDDVLEARFGVDREHHARRAAVRAHHALDAGGERHHVVGEALVHAVGDSAVVVQRGEHVLDLVEHVIDAGDVEVALLLAGERGVRQVFGRGRRAHRERGLGALALGDAFEMLADLLLQARLERRRGDPFADFLAGRGQRLDVVDVQAGQALGNALGQVVVLEEIAESQCRGGKTARNAHAGAVQLGDHLAQRCVLAADDLDIGHPQLLERQHVGAVHRQVGHTSLLLSGKPVGCARRCVLVVWPRESLS